jgi:K+-sensing histidine kinase KdpD
VHALFILLGVVLMGAWWGGFTTGITATVATLLVTAWFMPPMNSLRIESSRDEIYLGLAALEGLLISQFCARLRRYRVAHRVLVADLAALHRRADLDRRRLHDLEDDLHRLEEAIPLRVGPALDGLHQARTDLRNSGCVAQAQLSAQLERAERQVSEFVRALEEYAGFHSTAVTELVPSARVIDRAVSAMAGRGPAPEITLPEKMPAVAMREADLLRVFTELLANAAKCERPRETPQVRIECRRQRMCWVFSVTDQGTGMIPLKASRAFLLFGSEQPERLGVGLAICRRIVRAYGGEMWIESRQALGCTVYFTIPLPPGANPAE